MNWNLEQITERKSERGRNREKKKNEKKNERKKNGRERKCLLITYSKIYLLSIVRSTCVHIYIHTLRQRKEVE